MVVLHEVDDRQGSVPFVCTCILPDRLTLINHHQSKQVIRKFLPNLFTQHFCLLDEGRDLFLRRKAFFQDDAMWVVIEIDN